MPKAKRRVTAGQKAKLPAVEVRPARAGPARRFLKGVPAVLGGLLLFSGVLAYAPIGERPLEYSPRPSPSFAAAVDAFREQAGSAPGSLQPECRDILLHHNRRTPRAFVLLHGLSNCPAQFRALGRLLHERGYNVLIPRLPHHGEKDRLSTQWKDLSAQTLLDSANRATDLARGLGDQVTVIGLSVNGTVAAWIAQHREDVDTVAILAPALGPKQLSEPWLDPAARVVLRLPNRFYWWDPEKRDKGGGAHAYPRFPTHAVAQVMRIGVAVLRESRAAGPKCRSVLLVTTEADDTENRGLTKALVSRWRRHRPQSVRTYAFPAEMRVDHDFIDPTSPLQRTALVYPTLMALLAAGSPTFTPPE